MSSVFIDAQNWTLLAWKCHWTQAQFSHLFVYGPWDPLTSNATYPVVAVWDSPLHHSRCWGGWWWRLGGHRSWTWLWFCMWHEQFPLTALSLSLVPMHCCPDHPSQLSWSIFVPSPFERVHGAWAGRPFGLRLWGLLGVTGCGWERAPFLLCFHLCSVGLRAVPLKGWEAQAWLDPHPLPAGMTAWQPSPPPHTSFHKSPGPDPCGCCHVVGRFPPVCYCCAAMLLHPSDIFQAQLLVMLVLLQHVLPCYGGICPVSSLCSALLRNSSVALHWQPAASVTVALRTGLLNVQMLASMQLKLVTWKSFAMVT